MSARTLQVTQFKIDKVIVFVIYVCHHLYCLFKLDFIYVNIRLANPPTAFVTVARTLEVTVTVV